MKQLVDRAIVLTRTNYAEADRIITVLTPKHGKLRLMAKGVRRAKSKLAGGIELLSVSEITFIRGRGDIGTLVSARLERHFGHIVEDYDTTMLAYDLLKKIHRATEDEPDTEYFSLLEQALAALDANQTDLQLIKVWFYAQLLMLDGYTPELTQDVTGKALQADEQYVFSFEDGGFLPHEHGQLGKDQIKCLRLLFSHVSPAVLLRIEHLDELLHDVDPIVTTLFQQTIRQ